MPVTNSAPFRVVGFTKLFFVNLPGMSLKNMYKRIQEWLDVSDLVVFVSRLIFCESYQGAEYDQLLRSD